MNHELRDEDDKTGGATDDTVATSTTQDNPATGSVNNDSGAKEPGQDVQYENDTIRKSIR